MDSGRLVCHSRDLLRRLYRVDKKRVNEYGETFEEPTKSKTD